MSENSNIVIYGYDSNGNLRPMGVDGAGRVTNVVYQVSTISGTATYSNLTGNYGGTQFTNTVTAAGTYINDGVITSFTNPTYKHAIFELDATAFTGTSFNIALTMQAAIPVNSGSPVWVNLTNTAFPNCSSVGTNTYYAVTPIFSNTSYVFGQTNGAQQFMPVLYRFSAVVTGVAITSLSYKVNASMYS